MTFTGYPMSGMTDAELDRMVERHFDQMWEEMNAEPEIDPYPAIFKLEEAMSLITKAVDMLMDGADCVDGTSEADRIISLGNELEDFYFDVAHQIKRLEEDV